MALGALAWSIATSVHAQAPNAIPTPPAGHARVSARWDGVFHTGTDRLSLPDPAGLVTGPATYTSFSNVLTLDVDLGHTVLRGVIPMSWERISTPGVGASDAAEFGNVELESLANVALDSGEMRLLIGGGVALPTATDQGSNTGSEVRLLAWESGFRNAPAWAASSLTIWMSIEYQLAIEWLWVSVVGTTPTFFPIARDGGPQPLAHGIPQQMLALDASASIRIARTFDVGLAFLTWALPSGINDPYFAGHTPDLGQAALTLIVRTDPAIDAPVFGGTEFIFDLDERWGPTGAPGKLWGLRAFLAARIDV
jgi:hypothetical protein